MLSKLLPQHLHQGFDRANRDQQYSGSFDRESDIAGHSLEYLFHENFSDHRRSPVPAHRKSHQTAQTAPDNPIKTNATAAIPVTRFSSLAEIGGIFAACSLQSRTTASGANRWMNLNPSQSAAKSSRNPITGMKLGINCTGLKR